MTSQSSIDQNIISDISVYFFRPYNQSSSSQFAIFLEPLESELAVQVEYDMDEQGRSIASFQSFFSNVTYSS